MLRATTARAHADMALVTSSNAQRALRIVALASTGKAVAAQAQDHAQAAQISLTTRPTRDRDPSIQTTAAGDATQDTTTKMASASAAPTRAVGRISTDRVHVITRVATATSATAASPIV